MEQAVCTSRVEATEGMLSFLCIRLRLLPVILLPMYAFVLLGDAGAERLVWSGTLCVTAYPCSMESMTRVSLEFLATIRFLFIIIIFICFLRYSCSEIL